jgi:chromosome partitioning protein
MAEIISILNEKGGVGKTTTTINLGKALSLRGQRVLLIDNDPQAHMTAGLGFQQPSPTIYHSYKQEADLPIVNVGPNFFAVPSEPNLRTLEFEIERDVERNYKMRLMLAPVQDQFDFILIDCPPTTGVFSQNAIIASHKYMIITQTAAWSINGVDIAISLIEYKIKRILNPSIELLGILVTKLRKRTIAAEYGIQRLEEDYGDKLFRTRIGHTVKFEESEDFGEDIFTHAPESTAAADYAALADELLERYGKKS